jgi:diaminopimelate decarboxylase
MRMGGGPSAFGVDAERVPGMLEEIGRLGLDFAGLHVYAGSQSLDAGAIAETQHRTLDLFIELARHAPAPPRWLNLGGGFGIPYFPGQQPLDLGPIAERLAARLPGVRAALPEAEVVLELGRYLVGEAGVYVCRVVERKVSRGRVYLVTDGGMHHHLAASGNLGQVLRKNYPVLVGNRMGQEATETVSVVGPLCTPLDILADRIELPRADVGDLVVVLQSGAYGLTASPTAFLGHPPPAEVLV